MKIISILKEKICKLCNSKNIIHNENVEIKEEVKKEKEILCTGANCNALSIWDFPTPTGICKNPDTKEIREYVKKDNLGQLLNNPITYCIFCDKTNMYCFYSGTCKNKMNIDYNEIEKYSIATQELLENKYGQKPN